MNYVKVKAFKNALDFKQVANVMTRFSADCANGCLETLSFWEILRCCVPY